MKFRIGWWATLHAGAVASSSILFSGVVAAQGGGETGDSTGIPQGVIVGLGILVVVGLALVLRRSMESDDDVADDAWSNPRVGGPELNGPRYGSEQRNDPSVAGPDGDRGISAITHILAFFFWIFGPIIIYIISTNSFVKQNAANALNWQVSLALYAVLLILLIQIGIAGPILVLVLGVIDLVFIIVATFKAISGVAWSYPFALRIM